MEAQGLDDTVTGGCGGVNRKPSDRENAGARGRDTIMSVPVDDGENYPGHSYPASQLLYAAKRKLHETALGGRYVPRSCNP